MTALGNKQQPQVGSSLDLVHRRAQSQRRRAHLARRRWMRWARLPHRWTFALASLLTVACKQPNGRVFSNSVSSTQVGATWSSSATPCSWSSLGAVPEKAAASAPAPERSSPREPACLAAGAGPRRAAALEERALTTK
eukprot:5344341-Pyramimonas_sp.AAC.1